VCAYRVRCHSQESVGRVQVVESSLPSVSPSCHHDNGQLVRSNTI
jgi:hypothetical protein